MEAPPQVLYALSPSRPDQTAKFIAELGERVARRRREFAIGYRFAFAGAAVEERITNSASTLIVVGSRSEVSPSIRSMMSLAARRPIS